MEKTKREELEQLYHDFFKPEDYLNTYYNGLDKEYQFFLTNLHKYFNSRGMKKQIFFS